MLPEANVRPNSAESGSDIDSQVCIFVGQSDATRMVKRNVIIKHFVMRVDVGIVFNNFLRSNVK